MKVLVTGGAGFIGSHVADAYVAQGHDVWILDDLSTGRRENLPTAATFVHADICDPSVRDLFREVRFDLVSHHAAQLDVRVSVEQPMKDATINVLGILNVLEGAAEVGVRRVVFASSGGVLYGDAKVRPTPEATPKVPISPYGVTKLASEHYLYYYRVVRGLECVALRYSNVYGPRQDPHGEAGVVAIFSNRLIDGEPIYVFGDGEQTRDYVFVGDVVRANMVASEMDLAGAATDVQGIDELAFNVGTGIPTSVNRLAEILEASASRPPRRVYRDARAGELQHNTLDAARLRGQGWEPGTALEDGLKQTFAHIANTRGGTR
jgi:UDP-glucose 4-epimerase